MSLSESSVAQPTCLAQDASCRQYVLDTNVLLHDPTALFRFEEHNIYLPMVVLEELDRHKKGVDDVARNARQVTRALDELLQAGSMAEGFSLSEASRGVATGRLHFIAAAAQVTEGLDNEKADNKILACVRALLDKGLSAVLVTKDINLRVKALATDIPAQDYRSDRVLQDSDVLPPGYLHIDADFWGIHTADQESFWRKGGRDYARLMLELPLNSFLIDGASSARAKVWRVIENADGMCVVVQEPRPAKEGMLQARNIEQQLAQTLLFDENIHAVSLLGLAGSGKTLLAIAAGLQQVQADCFESVLITRATVPMGDDIGFLPGSEQEKMDPWVGGPLRDAFSVLGVPEKTARGESAALRAKVEIASMSFMRGRSFHNKFIIIDEAQNLTVKQTRALLTRAGDGSKVVLTGNMGQIDTPYLDEGSSGLAYAVKTLQGWAHAGHLILPRCVRSPLAAYIEDAARKEGAPLEE